ncbi:MAG: protease inhibitor I42 family protein [Chitinophagales bacterium]
MNKRGITILLLCLVMLLGLVGGAMAASYGENDNGKKVTVLEGDTFTLQLPSNPSTGYSWGPVEFDQKVLKQESQEQIPSKTGAIGSAGSEQWVFKANKAGSTQIKVSYSRPWEGRPPAKQYALDVKVIAPQIYLGTKETGKKITVYPGQKVIVSLPPVKASGYAWQVTGADKPGLKLLKHYHKTNGRNKVTAECWSFNVKSDVTQPLTITCQRTKAKKTYVYQKWSVVLHTDK